MEAQAKAIQLLEDGSASRGFLASTHVIDNYKRVWTRDGVITGLASLLSGNKKLIKTFESTLITIFEHQHPVGFLPSNVAEDGSVSYGGTVGRVDNAAWGIIGLCQYALITGDHSLARKYEHKIEKLRVLMEAWEFNGKHLMYVPQSGDWADEYIQHGYVLFDQLLRLWALRLIVRIYGRDDLDLKCQQIAETITVNFWKSDGSPKLYAPNLFHQMAQAPANFWFMGFNPSRIYRQFDLQANALALLLDIGSPEQKNMLVEFVQSRTAEQKLVPSFWPSIDTEHWEMNELRENYAYSFRNKPGEFHNGGLWPVWNGILVYALMSKGQTSLAYKIYQNVVDLVAKNDWDFNECFHGETHAPVGVPKCVWSGAGLLIAHETINGKSLFF